MYVQLFELGTVKFLVAENLQTIDKTHQRVAVHPCQGKVHKVLEVALALRMCDMYYARC